MISDAWLIEELLARREHCKFVGYEIMAGALDRAIDRLTAQAAVIEGMVEALGPFAIVGDLYLDGSLQSVPGAKEVEFCFRVSDFRRASERVSAVRGEARE